MTIETRSSLLHRVRDPADASGWREFDALYRPLLTVFVQRRGLSGADAGDVVQEIFARLCQALPDFELDRSRGGFRCWLWRVARNAIADWGRGRKRDDRVRDAWQHRPPRADEEPDAEWTAGYRERIMEFALERVRENANPRTWTCFEQWLLQERPAEAIARELGIEPGSVRVNANRMLEAVRAKCADYLEELSDGPTRLPG